MAILKTRHLPTPCCLSMPMLTHPSSLTVQAGTVLATSAHIHVSAHVQAHHTASRPCLHLSTSRPIAPRGMRQVQPCSLCAPHPMHMHTPACTHHHVLSHRPSISWCLSMPPHL